MNFLISATRIDGTEDPVRVTCNYFHGARTHPNDVSDDVGPQKRPEDDNRTRRIGLIAGLCTVAAICVLVIVLLFILRFKR